MDKIEGLGGSVDAQSEPGQGTTFVLVFPVCHAAVEDDPLTDEEADAETYSNTYSNSRPA